MRRKAIYENKIERIRLNKGIGVVKFRIVRRKYAAPATHEGAIYKAMFLKQIVSFTKSEVSFSSVISLTKFLIVQSVEPWA